MVQIKDIRNTIRERFFVPNYAMLCYAMLCYAMLCYAYSLYSIFRIELKKYKSLGLCLQSRCEYVVLGNSPGIVY